MTKQILIFSASSNNNLKLAESFKKEIEAQGKRAKIVLLLDLNLPLYNPMKEKEFLDSEDIQKLIPLREEMIVSEAMIFVAPEYNGGVPPSLNNFIAWISRSGDDWREAFNNKKCAIATHSGGGGAQVLMTMRLQLSYIGLNVIGRQIQTSFSKPLNPESLSSVVTELIK